MIPTSSHLLAADPAYSRLKEHIIAATGLAYYGDKDGDLVTRIALRLGRLGLQECGPYLALLKDGMKGEEELDALIEDLTIGETFFFRHREMFDALRDVVLPGLIAKNCQSRQLRIWSAGCSTGAEPYSVSILLRRDLASQLEGWDVTIVGTDINREFLARARNGLFEEWAFRGTAAELRRDCFIRSGNFWLIDSKFRDVVSFQYHNLVTHPFPSLLNNLFAFDLILCRNVTIYFGPEIVQRIVRHFHQCLVPGGWLLVGHAEPNTETFRDFRTVNTGGAVLYQKTREQESSAACGEAFEFSALQATAKLQPSAWTPPVVTWEPPVADGAGSLPVPSPSQAPAAKVTSPKLEEIRVLADRGAWDQAALRCREALEMDALNPVVHFYQALVFEQTGHHTETEQALRRAIYLDRNFALAHYYLGLLLQKHGRLAHAGRSFRNVLQLLANFKVDHIFADGDGLTAGELIKLTQMHLRVLDAT